MTFSCLSDRTARTPASIFWPLHHRRLRLKPPQGFALGRGQASKRFLELWCQAAADGKLQEFDHEWGCSLNQTTGIDGSPADMLRGDSEAAESQIACECPEPIMTTDVVTEELMTADAAEQQTAAAASIVPETDGVL